MTEFSSQTYIEVDGFRVSGAASHIVPYIMGVKEAIQKLRKEQSDDCLWVAVNGDLTIEEEGSGQIQLRNHQAFLLTRESRVHYQIVEDEFSKPFFDSGNFIKLTQQFMDEFFSEDHDPSEE